MLEAYLSHLGLGLKRMSVLRRNLPALDSSKINVGRNSMKYWLGLASALVALAGCGGNGEGTNNLPTRRNVSQNEVDRASKDLQQGKSTRVIDENNSFGFRLFAELQKSKPGTNALISPLGVASALSMVYNGAAAETKEGMDKVLGYKDVLLQDINNTQKQYLTVFASPDPKVQVDIANSLWARSGVEFKPEFLSRIQDVYGAKPTVMDFQSPDAPKQINAWVAQATREKIREMVKTIPEDTVMFLLNAVYFKGLWKQPFDPKNTEEKDFTNFEGKKVPVSMMMDKGEFEYLANDKLRMVRLPYGSGRLAMLVALPSEGKDLKALSKEMTVKNWTAWMAGFKSTRGTVFLPRLKSEFEAVLNDPLSELGMGVAFSDKANFSGIRDANDLFIRQVLHKTTIEVNEEGAEASAATKVEVGVTSAPAQPIKEFVFSADRPFYYAIADKTTGALLFLGVYGDPK